MSLLSNIQLASNSLAATQVGLQVVGQNVANANTPGYIREVVNFQPGPSQRDGNLVEGSGVQVTGITQQIDNFLEQRVRAATSDVSSSKTQSQTYQQLESLMGELSSNGLGTSLTKFFSSISDVLNNPSSVSTRNLAVLKGQTLTGNINQLAQQVIGQRNDINTQVISSVSSINTLVDQIRDLNVRIAQLEGGDTTHSQAVGLRDQRNTALKNLANIININVNEQPNGEVTVYSGSNFLVFEGENRHVKVAESSDRGTTVANIVLADTNTPLGATSGQVVGLINSRDQIFGGFLDQLNTFAGTLANEFNKVYSSGQGLTGFNSVTSQRSVDDPTKPLDATGLPFAPVNGSFQVQVLDTKTGLTQTTNINVSLDGLDTDTSLNDVAAQLNQVSGISASVSANGQLTIQTSSPNQQISFAQDSSGLLASLGINTFFSGTSALNLSISQSVVDDPSKFAISQGGVGQDTNNGVALAGFLDTPLASQNGNSLSTLHSALVDNVTQASAQSSAQAAGFQTLEASLDGQSQAISGVSIDEEAVNMLTFQRVFQASAKYISTINDLLNTLVHL